MITLKEFKKLQLINDSICKKILSEFNKITGLNCRDCKILGIYEEFQSDCDGDDNKLDIEISYKIYYDKPQRLELQPIFDLYTKKYDMTLQATQVITGSNDYPCVKTLFRFDYYISD